MQSFINFLQKISLVSYLGEDGSDEKFIRKNLKKYFSFFHKEKNHPLLLKGDL